MVTFLPLPRQPLACQRHHSSHQSPCHSPLLFYFELFGRLCLTLLCPLSRSQKHFYDRLDWRTCLLNQDSYGLFQVCLEESIPLSHLLLLRFLKSLQLPDLCGAEIDFVETSFAIAIQFELHRYHHKNSCRMIYWETCPFEIWADQLTHSGCCPNDHSRMKSSLRRCIPRTLPWPGLKQWTWCHCRVDMPNC